MDLFPITTAFLRYVVGRKKAGSRTTAERQKLRYKVKREMKVRFRFLAIIIS